jgi:hypothetical protein
MAAVSKILWLNGGIAQSIASADTVNADGVWTFTGSHMVLDGYIDASGFSTDASGNVDASGYIHALGDLSVSNGKFVVDASGNFDASGNGQIDGSLSVDGVSVFGNDLTVNGDLTINGNIVSRGQVDVVIKDTFLDLSFGNSIAGTASVASSSGGFTVTQARNGNFKAGKVTGFPSSTSFNYIQNDAADATLLAAGDVVSITGLPSELAENEGFFVVASVDQAQFPQVVTIESSLAASLPWMQTAFQDGTPGTPGEAYKPNLSVLAIADGTSSFKSGAGATWPVGTLVLASYIGAQANGATKGLFQANGAYVAVGAGSTTLQNAYDNGNSISTSSSRNVYITGSEALLVDASGGVDISGVDLTVVGGAVDVTLALGKDFAVDGNGQQEGFFYIGVGQPVAAYEMHAAGNTSESATNMSAIASTAHTLRATSGAMTVAGNSLALDASGAAAAITASTEISATAPRVFLDATGADIDASNNAISLTASTSILADAPAIKLDASGATLDASGDALLLDASASILAQAPAIKLDASGAQIDASSNALALDASASIIAIAPQVKMDASGAQVDAANDSVAIDASASILAVAPRVFLDASGAQVDASNNALALDASASIAAVAPAILLDASGAQIDASLNALALDASASIIATAPQVKMDGSGAQIDAANDSLALDASASIIAAAPAILLSASGASVDASSNALSLDASGAIDLSAVSTSSFAVSSGDLDLSASGDLSLTSASLTSAQSGAASFTALSFLADASGAQLDLSGNVAQIDASGAIALNAGAALALTPVEGMKLQSNAGAGIPVQNASGASLAAGTILSLVPNSAPSNDYAPKVKSADANSATVSERRILGVVQNAAIADAAVGYAASVPGTVCHVAFDAAPAQADIGAPVFLSETAGQATMTAPNSAGCSVVQLGYLVNSTADANGNYAVALAPQFIATIPA